MEEKPLNISRRHVLAGLGTVGLASVGAGLGTSAYFNDTEAFENNELAAGALNLAVSVDLRAYSEEMPEPTIVSVDGPDDTADGNVVTITANDVKPGDWFILEWDPEVYGNPGYLQVTSVDADYANLEGANPESETETTGSGDLGGAFLTTIWHDFVSISSDARDNLKDLDETTDLNDTWLASYETPDLDGVTASSAHYTTMDEAHDVYKTGVTLRDPSTGDPLVVGSGAGAATFYQLFELPLGVGNAVQGDSITFTVRFDAEQVRHNDTPFNSS